VEPTPTLARRLWQAIEPLHAVVYFHPEPTEALKRLGARSWWMSYFAGRFAPLGPIGPAPATALAYGFAPAMVARSLPDAWTRVAPGAAVDARVGASAEVLAATLPGAADAVGELAKLLGEAASACRYEGRPLAAGWLEVDPGDDPHRRLWAATTVLREHRGDGHVIAGVSLGLRGLEAAQTHVATGAVTRDLIQRNRGWTDDEWEDGIRRLQARGLLDRDGRLTKRGGTLRRRLEETTDRLAAAPVERLGQLGVERVIELAAPLSRHLIDTGLVPVPNPIGVPRP
jgi:hypothetical protein